MQLLYMRRRTLSLYSKLVLIRSIASDSAEGRVQSLHDTTGCVAPALLCLCEVSLGPFYSQARTCLLLMMFARLLDLEAEADCFATLEEAALTDSCAGSWKVY